MRAEDQVRRLALSHGDVIQTFEVDYLTEHRNLQNAASPRSCPAPSLLCSECSYTVKLAASVGNLGKKNSFPFLARTRLNGCTSLRGVLY